MSYADYMRDHDLPPDGGGQWEDDEEEEDDKKNEEDLDEEEKQREIEDAEWLWTEMFSTLDLSDLECLIMWPPGTVGEAREKRAIADLRRLFVEFGFGRVAQLAGQMEELWRHPEKQGEFRRRKDEHVEFLKQ